MVSGLSESRAIEATVVLRCLRCGGLMVSESGVELVVHRCVQCGERVDSVILQNRQHIHRGHGRGVTDVLSRSPLSR